MTVKKVAARWRRGFTLIELLVVVLIIGILADIAVPQYFRVMEKGRFAEALAYFQTLKGSQERYLLGGNGYANNTGLLDLPSVAFKHFTVAAPAAGPATWSITLTRGVSPCPGGNCYTVSYSGPAGNMACGGANATLCTPMLP